MSVSHRLIIRIRGGRQGNMPVLILVYLCLSLSFLQLQVAHSNTPEDLSGNCQKKSYLSQWHAHAVATEIQYVPLAAAVLTSITLNSVTKACWHLSGNFLLEIDHVRNFHLSLSEIKGPDTHACMQAHPHKHKQACLAKVKCSLTP